MNYGAALMHQLRSWTNAQQATRVPVRQQLRANSPNTHTPYPRTACREASLLAWFHDTHKPGAPAGMADRYRQAQRQQEQETIYPQLTAGGARGLVSSRCVCATYSRRRALSSAGTVVCEVWARGAGASGFLLAVQPSTKDAAVDGTTGSAFLSAPLLGAAFAAVVRV
jgi:hypothetical protein